MNSQGVSVEPTLPTLGKVFGYTTEFIYKGQSLNQGGRVTTAGDEVLSPYWSRAKDSLPVRVTELAAYHQIPNTATLCWYPQGSTGSPSKNSTSGGLDGQTVLPRLRSCIALTDGTLRT